MTEISISEFRNNIKYYSSKVTEEDLIVTSNGKPIMKITNPNKNRRQIVESLYGCIPVCDENEIYKKRLKEL